MTNAENLRQVALAEANKLGGTPAAVIKRAAEYEKFLKGK